MVEGIKIDHKIKGEERLGSFTVGVVIVVVVVEIVVVDRVPNKSR